MHIACVLHFNQERAEALNTGHSSKIVVCISQLDQNYGRIGLVIIKVNSA